MDERRLRDYLRQCDVANFENPQTGLEMALRAPEMARRIPGRPDLVALAIAKLADAYRANNESGRAEEVYGEALDLSESCPPSTLATIYGQYAYFCAVAQRRFEEALQFALRAVEIFEKHDAAELPLAYLIRGSIHLSGSRHDVLEVADAVADFATTLRLVDPAKEPRTAFAAVHNFAIAIAEGHSRPADLETALGALASLRPEPGSVPAAKIFWGRGLIADRFGAETRALKLLEHARAGLARHGLPIETALVSFDLSTIHHRLGNWKELEETATHALFLFRERFSTEALTALLLWRDAVSHREADERMLRGVRQAVATGEVHFLQGLGRAVDGPALPGSSSSTSPPSFEEPASLARERHAVLRRTRVVFGPLRRPRRSYPDTWTGRFRLRLEPDDAAAVDHLARRERLSRPELVRRLLRRAVGLPPRDRRRRRVRGYPDWKGQLELALDPDEAVAVDRAARAERLSRSEFARRRIRQAMKPTE